MLQHIAAVIVAGIARPLRLELSGGVYHVRSRGDGREDIYLPDADRLGIRYIMGAPVTRVHCITVLKEGFQHQRIPAADYLCLIDPSTPLFSTAAPAWRQQRLRARME